MSFPNPLMLPFLAAGGAISGSSFGLFYTVLMQIGYNYYGKRALKQMEDGRKLQDVLMDISKEVQPFSDQMMEIALAKMPDVIDKSVVAFEGLITQRIKNLQKTLVGEQSGISEFDKMVLGWFGIQTAEARRGGGETVVETYEHAAGEHLAEHVDTPPPPPPEITGTKTITKQVTDKGTKQRLRDAIGINERRIELLIKAQRKKLEALKGLYKRKAQVLGGRTEAQWFAVRPKTKSGSMNELSILNKQIKDVPNDIRIWDREIQLLRSTNVQLRKNLAGMGG